MSSISFVGTRIAVAFLLSAVGAAGATAMAGASPIAATTLFVNGDAARDGDGSEASPFNNLASLQAALLRSSMRGITTYLAGTFHGQRLSVEQGLFDCAFRQWPGQAQAIVRGDTIITDPWTEHVPGKRYSVAVGPEADVVGAVEDWDARVDSQGRHFGHLTRVSTTAAVEAAEGSWFYDGALLHIHAIHDENPSINGRTYAWGVGGSAFFLLNDSHVTIDGLHFKLWLDPDPGEGYGVFMGAAFHCVIRNCLANDYGYHGFGFVGLSCRSNTFDSCVTRGGRANGSTAYIFYAFTDRFGVLDGCRAYSCQAHLYRHLDVYGSPPPFAINSSADGFYIHVDGGMITDVEYHDCVAYGYETRSGYGFAVGKSSTNPTDPNDPETYPVRFYDCRLINGVTNDINGGASAAYVRCSFDLLRMAELLPPSATAIGAFGGPLPTRLLFESCVFMVNTDGQADASCFGIEEGVTANFRGCVIYDHGLDAKQRRSIFRYAHPTASVSASQTVFAHRTRQYLAIANSPLLIAPAAIDLHDCWYHNIRTEDGYGPHPQLDSQPEFQAIVDRSGIFDVDPQFAAVPMDLEGARGGLLHTTQLVLSGVHHLGINLESYDGRYGAYQYGGPSCPADLSLSAIVNGLDLAMLLAAWGTPPGAVAVDLNRDGSVNGIDLAILLAAWGPCP